MSKINKYRIKFALDKLIRDYLAELMEQHGCATDRITLTQDLDLDVATNDIVATLITVVDYNRPAREEDSGMKLILTCANCGSTSFDYKYNGEYVCRSCGQRGTMCDTEELTLEPIREDDEDDDNDE